MEHKRDSIVLRVDSVDMAKNSAIVIVTMRMIRGHFEQVSNVSAVQHIDLFFDAVESGQGWALRAIEQVIQRSERDAKSSRVALHQP